MSRLGKILLLFSGLTLVMFGLTRFILGAWVPYLWILLGLFAAFVLAAMFVDRQFFKEVFSMKTTKHGMNMGAMILLFLSVVILLNFLAVRNVKTWDFSTARKNTLSDQSIQLLKNLDSELKVIFFYKKGQEGAEENKNAFRELVKKYQDQSTKVALDFVEVNENPTLTKDYGVDRGSGIVFVTYKGRKNRIDKIDEQELTNALVKVTREREKTIYFVVGHGELNLEESREATGLFQLKSLLENNNYKVKTWTTNTSPQVPNDADLVVVAGPKQNLIDYEITALEDYLRQGGNLFIALENESQGFDRLLGNLGLKFQKNIVLNYIEFGGGARVVPQPTFASLFSAENEITKVFGRSEVTLFLRPSELKKIETLPSGVNVDEIVRTPPASVAFKELNGNPEGPKGPFTIAASSKGKYSGGTKDYQAVIVGDADFFNNQYLMQNLNRDLVLNSIASLAKEPNLISITPKEIARTEIDPSSTKRAPFFFGFVIPLPLVMLITSLVLWFRRRYA